MIIKADVKGFAAIIVDADAPPKIPEVKLRSAEKSEAGSSSERRAPRERAFLQARMSFANGAMSISCLVTQISMTGAKISVDSHAPLPDRFHITIPQRGIDCPARLVWRREGSAALAFISNEDSGAEAGLGLRERLRVLEAENAMLRANVASLSAELKKFTDGY